MADLDGEDASGGAEPDATVTAAHEGVPDLGGWPAHDRERYQLGDEIAHGGGGRVIAARDRRLGRDVAVKVPLEAPGAPARLVREAQLMSRLEHPSIVAVHDLVRDERGTPFYVMPLLDGGTLRVRIDGRSFEERIALLPTLIAIADAIAYAHHRGVIHRDLKPGNVIVGRFGETSVIDWGLARTIAGASDDRAGPEATSGAGAAVTVTGAIVGTPAYMAPEQARGEVVDARADVYGLGALCYHVLGGDPPYRGDAATVLARVLAGGPPPLTTREPRVATDLAAIVAKAMARDPADRYPDAEALAADLRRYQDGRLVAAHRYSPWQRARRWNRRHRRAVALGALGVAAAIALAIAWPAGGVDARAMCGRSRERVDAVWTPAIRATLAERVRGTAAPGAGVAAAAITARLDDRAQVLSAARVEACAATHVRGEQSADLLDRRMACLNRRVAELAATVKLFDQVADDDVDGLRRAVETLAPIATCADVAQLRDDLPLPADEPTRERVLALQARIADVIASLEAGRYPSALALVTALRADPAVESYAPLDAEVRYAEGRARASMDQLAAAEPLLRQSLNLAERAHDDRQRADSTYRLAGVLRDLDRYDEAMLVIEALDALGERVGDPSYQVRGLTLTAQILDERGQLTEALAVAEAAVRRWEALGGDEAGLADLIGNVGTRLINMSRYPDAEPHVRRALALHERRLGRDHPQVARSVFNLAAVLQTTGRGEEALPLYDRSLAIFEGAGLGESTEVLHLLNNVATLLTELERFDEARARMLRALALVEAKRGPGHVLVGKQLYNLGNNELARHDGAAAEPWMRKAVEHTTRYLGDDHLSTANARWGLAAALLEQAQPAAAVPLLRAALPIQRQETGADSEDVAYTLFALARGYLELGRPADALGPATECQAYFAAQHDRRERGEARWYLARALDGLGRDRARVIALATAARDDLVEAKATAAELAAIDRLLR